MFSLTNILIRTVGLLVIALGFIFLAFGYFDEQYEGILFSLPTLWVGWLIFDYPTAKRLKIELKIKSLPEFSEADFAHVYGTTGLAINNKNQTICLVAGVNKKLYTYETVRSWHYVFANDDGGSGTSLGYQMGVQNRNAEETGLFFQMKDIDFPEWH